MMPAVFRYIKMKAKVTDNKCLYWTCLIFFIFVFLYLISLILLAAVCQNVGAYMMVRDIAALLFVIQTLLLLAILFMRLYVVFKGTMYALSSVTIKLYWIIYSLCILFFIVAGISFVNLSQTIIGSIIVAFAFLLIIIMVSVLIALFLYKMAQVYKSVDTENSNPALIAIITKTNLLAIISIVSTLITAIFVTLETSIWSNSIPVFMISRLLVINDVFTNFWCIILSSSIFNNWYLKICKCCHLRCESCWYRIVGKIPTKVTKLTVTQPKKMNPIQSNSVEEQI